MELPQSIPQGLAAVASGRDVLPTAEAARAINRRDQTLRRWASLGNGPVLPLRINGRLAWRVSDLACLLNGQEVSTPQKVAA